SLADEVRGKAPPELPPELPFRIDRVWFWHPVGNEELVVAAGCARKPAHLACGVGVFRARTMSAPGAAPGEAADAGTAVVPSLVGFASSGWWMAVVKTDHGDRDLWVYGGDGNSSFRRRVAYVWGRIALGEPERTRSNAD